MQRTFLAALAAALALAACSGQQNARQPAAPSALALHNRIDFPLFPGASVLSARSYVQTIQVPAGAENNSIFTAGNGTYQGNEVIASTGAPFEQVSNWVDRMNAAPPSGYSSVENGEDPQQHADAERYGLNYALFTKKDGGKTKGLLVIAMDPHRVNLRFGVLLGLIARYKALPAVMRDPIDQEAKSRIGMTISEATQPDSPVGAALSALDQFEHKDSRGIVLIDATKR